MSSLPLCLFDLFSRHVYLPLRMEPALLPWIDAISPIFLVDDTNPAVGPGLMLRDCMESYARDAVNDIKIVFHTIFCWENDTTPVRIVGL